MSPTRKTQRRETTPAGPGSPDPPGTADRLLDRPLTARSIIASLLLGMHPPRLSSARLVRWCSLFDVSEGTARVALSRMVERGELAADGGVYELSGSVRQRQPAQDWVLVPELAPWDGAWCLGVVTADARTAPERAALRGAAATARLAEVREGVWARPDNLPPAATDPGAWAVLAGQCRWWRGHPDEPDGDLAARLFGTDAWATRALLLVGRLDPVCSALERGDLTGLADGFVTGAAALQHVRRDPLLPAALLPDAWPGDRLRAAYHRYRATYGRAVAGWFAAEPRGA